MLLMLITVGGLVAAAILLAIAWLHESAWLRKFVIGASTIWTAFYFALLIGTSLLSVERTLPIGEAKKFCGFYLDCHMHTAVTNVWRMKTIGNKRANGEFYIVRVKVFSNAKQAQLGLSNVDAHVVDARGRSYSRALDAEAELGEQPPFDREISPVESFEKEIVFDLPAEVKVPRLDIREGNGIDLAIEAALIGDEDSILHARNYFNLEVGKTTASVR